MDQEWLQSFATASETLALARTTLNNKWGDLSPFVREPLARRVDQLEKQMRACAGEAADPPTADIDAILSTIQSAQ